MTLATIQVVAVVAFVSALIVELALYSRLAALEERDAPQAWIADGRPVGFFTLPDDPSQHWSRMRTSVQWLFGTPEWTRTHERALRAHRAMRVSAGIGLASWLCIICLWVISSALASLG